VCLISMYDAFLLVLEQVNDFFSELCRFGVVDTVRSYEVTRFSLIIYLLL